MNELHKPLNKPEPKTISRAGIVWGLVAVGALLLSLTAYLMFDRQPTNRQVVALDDAAKTISPSGAGSPKNKSQSDQSKPLVLDENGNIDISSMKPLSPLEPLDSEGPEGNKPEQTVFKPKPAPPKRLSQWVPLPDLVERSEFGSLPRVSDGGLRPVDAYSQSSGLIGANRIAIVVGGLGLSQTGTQNAIRDLPSEISLGFSPFGNSLQRWMQNARKEGHEVILQIPMEPLGYPAITPGPRTLTSGATNDENLDNLRWFLGRMTNYPVVMNYLGAQFSNKPKKLEPILREIRKRGLGYIDDGSVLNSQALTLANDIRLPNTRGAVTIDSDRNPEKIAAKLRSLEAMARQNGFVLASGSAFPETIKAVINWAKDAQKRGIHIVPASNLLKDYTP